MRRTRGLDRRSRQPLPLPLLFFSSEEDDDEEDRETILIPSSSPPAARVRPSGEKARERGGSAKRVATAAKSHEGWE